MTRVGLYSRHEIELDAELDYGNALQEVSVGVEFENGGEARRVEGFWNGGRKWVVRFAPERTGVWEWRSWASSGRGRDGGLDGQSGAVECVSEPDGDGRRGPLRVAANGRHFVDSGGAPFFWLGDTVWNGPLKASAEEWAVFLADRARKGFNVIQFVATQWMSAAGDAEGRPAYLGRDVIRMEPAFFRRLDERIEAINAHGMVAAPVLAWTADWNADSSAMNPGHSLSEDQLVLLVKYLTSRYGAHRVAWILAGDGHYTGAEAERWRRIGRATLAGSGHPATMHPGGKEWVAGEFRNEPWFAFNGYQSGHWNDDDNHRWINEGPLSADWEVEPRCPQVNLEPCYEGHKGMATGVMMGAHDVRRASYWSLLAGPVAGVSYGAHGVWSWERWPELPLSHPGTGIAQPWQEAMQLEGSTSMGHLKAIFSAVEWWRLEPRPELLAHQPGRERPAAFIGMGASKEGDVAVAYLPEGGTAHVRTELLKRGLMVECMDPANGEVLWRADLDERGGEMDCGAGGDRVLVIRSER